MREYETTFVVQPEISAEGVAALTERPDREVMERLFGKRVMKEVEKVTKPAETKGE